MKLKKITRIRNIQLIKDVLMSLRLASFLVELFLHFFKYQILCKFKNIFKNFICSNLELLI